MIPPLAGAGLDVPWVPSMIPWTQTTLRFFGFVLMRLISRCSLQHEEERASWALLSQENRSLAEACEQVERGRQRLAQELQAKEAQLSCLEAQLAQATRRQTELEEELRRYSSWDSWGGWDWRHKDRDESSSLCPTGLQASQVEAEFSSQGQGS